MSLGAWFKEYFFFPLQLYWMRQLRSSFQQLLFVNLTLFATFILIGLWHGISAKYLLWGVLNASFVLTSPLLLTLRERFHQRSVDVLLICLTLLITFVGQLLLMSHGIGGFTRNLTDTFHPDKISGSDISIFFVLSILLSLQHVYDSYSRRLDYHGGQIKFVAIALQLMVVTMLHSSGVGFLYAEF